MYILVTGGLGFIGSHTVVKLVELNYNVIIYDNLCNSSIDTLDKINKITGMSNKCIFIEGDIRDRDKLESVFTTYNIYVVIHMAALKSVSESEKYPELYNDVNIKGTVNLLSIMGEYKCNNFIYSSSATVYGNTVSPVTEDSKTGCNLACNYAKNKYDMEQYLITNHSDWNIIILRYFNPIGSHPSGIIGEDPNGIPNNIFPYLLRVAKWTNTDMKDKYTDSPYSIFTIFGDTYNTKDGTCIRDYIHVQDLARAHTSVIKLFATNNIGLKIYNVGTGNGTSVMDLIKAFNNCLVKHKRKPIEYKIGDKRSGDLDISFANADKIYNEIGFKTIFTIDDMCRDGINFTHNINS